MHLIGLQAQTDAAQAQFHLHKLTGESTKVSELTAFTFEVSAIIRHWKARVQAEFVCECVCVCLCVYVCMYVCIPLITVNTTFLFVFALVHSRL
jgi:hypothetical protein